MGCFFIGNINSGLYLIFAVFSNEPFLTLRPFCAFTCLAYIMKVVCEAED